MHVTCSGQASIISGWGDLREGGAGPNIMNVATVPLITQSQCRRFYGRGNMEAKLAIQKWIF